MDYNTKRAYKDGIRKARKVDCLKAISLCKDLLKLSNSNNDKWFCYHNMALMYKKLGDVKKSLSCNDTALQHITSDNPDYYFSIWMRAECLELIGDSKSARNLYYECSSYYRYIDEKICRATILFNIAKSKKDIDKILKIMNITEEYLNCAKSLYEELNNSLIDMYTESLEICMNDINMNKYVFKIINNTKNIQLKNEMKKSIKKKYSRVS